MAENIERSSGRPKQYKFDRGGLPTEMGPFIGIVVNNVDNVRSGRVQVWIEEFGAVNADGTPKLDDPTLWRTVNYIPPFYGITPRLNPGSGVGTWPNNPQSYGMWFTPPDLGTKVICFFVAGDPAQGYYIGCVPELGLNHMIPAIGASTAYQTQNAAQQQYFSDAPQMPVAEINPADPKIANDPKFFDQTKPIHSYQAAIFFQQGLETDTERGPISSNAQRESPSTVYGISTPGSPVYQKVNTQKPVGEQLDSLSAEDVQIIGREGGHTLVMDDGDINGNNALFRLRSSKGHQIMMNDTGNFIYIMHSNGQTWIELGSEGTVDVFSTNSINLRSQGDVNIHADRDINMYAGRNFNTKSKAATNIGATTTMNIASEGDMTLFSQTKVGVKSDGSLALQATTMGSFDGGGSLRLKAARIDLNGLGASSVQAPKLYPKTTLPDVKFKPATGWEVEQNSLDSIVSRAPTHEPYPYHNQGVDVKVSAENG